MKMESSFEPNLDRRLNLHEVWKYSVFTMGKDLYEMCTTNANRQSGNGGRSFHPGKGGYLYWSGREEHCLSVHDVGRAINPDMSGTDWKWHQQGIGMALREEIKIDPITGRALITNFKTTR